jgi:hypothetical protein
MNEEQKQYYYDMAQRDRLFIFYHNERKVCLITFYITDNVSKYINRFQWETIDDSKNGYICYIDHLYTDKDFNNKVISHKIWHYFIEHIKKNFPQVEMIYWVRAKINPISLKREKKVYIKQLREVANVYS